jgi:hypothetical protein
VSVMVTVVVCQGQVNVRLGQVKSGQVRSDQGQFNVETTSEVEGIGGDDENEVRVKGSYQQIS